MCQVIKVHQVGQGVYLFGAVRLSAPFNRPIVAPPVALLEQTACLDFVVCRVAECDTALACDTEDAR